ncbi:Bug family tripartite tricarboxylate transporter substrate binding protein [Variovorax saccharolyticus]|uniref:Bug family tripartite tricarboxylate transporter substrate binding protein n=1 Tax=Variovorax saccharolyticus TaxID=3053516 RepID=UPI002578FCE7|nr:tripartite tricarboxylate transporter substrate binding protein [Variovorax sp. J22R187]MDM0021161.1 tripartite tricarboxylate transporter substrate binding protein [Variovorax sp. J22R187]
MKNLFPLRRLGLALATLALAAAPLSAARAQAFPAHPVRFIVPLGPGSGSDTITRLVAKLAAPELGQPTFVDNKPGGDTILAVQGVMAAPADGYSVLMLSPSSMVINPLVNDNLPYEPQRDLRPLATALRSAAVLVTAGNSPYKSFADVMAAARKSPKTVSMASYSHHYRIGSLMLQQAAGVEFNYIPYKSPAQVQTDLMGGSVDLALLDIGGAVPLIASGKLRALAVTGKERHPQLAQVPTVRESGLPNYDLYVWIGFGVNARTPEPVVKTLEAALLKAMGQPEFRNYVTQTAGAEVFNIPGKEMSAMIASESARYQQLARQVDIVQR